LSVFIATMLLTATLLRRLLREGIVLRAVAFPLGLTVATLLCTLGVVALWRGPAVVAVYPDTEVAVVEALDAAGFRTLAVPDPRGLVESGGATAGLEGGTLHTRGGRDAMMAEAAIRQSKGAGWWPRPRPLPSARQIGGAGTTIATLLGAIYALYGVVFGAGMVARDRDDGTLEVELVLPLPRWVHGVTRVVAGSLVLVVAIALAVSVVHGLTRVEAVGETLRHGMAACIMATCLGLGAVGRAGMKSGFAAALALGLSSATGLLGLGLALPAVGRSLPLASLVAGGSGWLPLVMALAACPVAVAVFTWRATPG
jgi:ABC-type Na+ efflux pump permease subunit